MSEDQAAPIPAEEVEHKTEMLVIDSELPSKIEALKADGWQLIPNVNPVAVYHLIRPKNRPKEMELKMVIDDTKVGILKADGSFVQQ